MDWRWFARPHFGEKFVFYTFFHFQTLFLAKSKGFRFPGKGMRFKTSNFEKGIVSGFILNFDEASV